MLPPMIVESFFRNSPKGSKKLQEIDNIDLQKIMEQQKPLTPIRVVDLNFDNKHSSQYFDPSHKFPKTILQSRQTFSPTHEYLNRRRNRGRYNDMSVKRQSVNQKNSGGNPSMMRREKFSLFGTNFNSTNMGVGKCYLSNDQVSTVMSCNGKNSVTYHLDMGSSSPNQSRKKTLGTPSKISKMQGCSQQDAFRNRGVLSV